MAGMDENPDEAPQFDGPSVPLAVEFVVRYLFRLVLYAIGFLLLVFAISGKEAGAEPGTYFGLAGAGCASLVLGWICKPRRQQQSKDS